MIFDSTFRQAVIPVLDWHERYEAAADRIADPHKIANPESELTHADRVRLTDILRETRDHVGLYHLELQRVLNRLLPLAFPNPDIAPPSRQIAWTGLPIHETEPSD